MNIYRGYNNQKILIAGCGRLGSCLASSLSNAGFDVIVIDKDIASFHRLSENFSGFEIVGDASDLNILDSANIKDCDVILVATNNDNVNCMIAQIANSIFQIANVYIRLNDPVKESLLENTSIQAIYPAKLCMKEFESLSHISLSDGDSI